MTQIGFKRVFVWVPSQEVHHPKLTQEVTGLIDNLHRNGIRVTSELKEADAVIIVCTKRFCKVLESVDSEDNTHEQKAKTPREELDGRYCCISSFVNVCVCY